MIPVNIVGKQGKKAELVEAHVYKFSTSKGDHAGMVVLSERFLGFNPDVKPFLNDSFGVAMNQDVSFGGTPEIIHNGGTSTEWTGSAIQGAWNFADGGKISLTTANNNDEAEFAEETPTTISMSGFTALTGKINLTIYNSVNNSIFIEFDLAGVTVGNNVDLNDYIDTGLIGTEQSFAIPKADLGLTTQSIDGFSILLSRTGGTKPTMTFDDIQLEQTGTPAVFKATTPLGTRFHVSEIRISLADNITGITAVSGATQNATVPNLAYDAILGVSALSNGIVFARVQKGKTLFSVTFRQLSDFLATADIFNHVSNGTNTFITLLVKFPEPIVLAGGLDEFISFTINDNLSGLLQFTAIARGAIEI